MTTAVAPARDSPAPVTPGVAFTHRQILAILAGLMLGILLAALDQTIVSTSIRTIADDLNGLDQQAWATTAYLMTATVSTPLYGKLSDLYGRRPFFLTAISVFILGSVLCTISQSMYELAAFRAVQGLGAGGLMSLAFAIIGDVVPPRERARYQGYFLAVFGSASVLGPLLGGAFAGADSILGIAGWRWVFLVNVPVAAAALLVVARMLNLPHTRREHRIDWMGALALSVGVVPMLLVAGLLLFSRVTVETPLWLTAGYMVIFGLGLGCNMQTLTLAVQAALPPQEMGTATSSATFFRQMGGTLGTAVFLSILFSTVGDRIGGAFRTVAPTPAFQAALQDPAVLSNPANQPVLSALKSGRGLEGVSIDDSSFINQLDPRLARPFLVGFSQSMDLVFLTASGVALAALVLVIFLREVPLSQHSGIVARQHAAAAAAAG
ncbi:MAG TPA: MDR family MFS transporter, partial [Pseudonocardiaceae bacterium]|nr:MDR family MFS transporter [Pseudonocardiaceae bacterium]